MVVPDKGQIHTALQHVKAHKIKQLFARIHLLPAGKVKAEAPFLHSGGRIGGKIEIKHWKDSRQHKQILA